MHEKRTVVAVFCILLFASFSAVFAPLTDAAYAQAPQTITPTITLVSSPCDLDTAPSPCLAASSTSIKFEITFNSAIDRSTFETADVVWVGNSEGGNLHDENDKFAYRIFVYDDDTVTLRIPAGSVSDTSGNTNSAAEITIRADFRHPTVQIPGHKVPDGAYRQFVQIKQPYIAPEVTCIDEVYEDGVLSRTDSYDAVADRVVSTDVEPEDLPRIINVRYSCHDAAQREGVEHLKVHLVENLAVFNMPPTVTSIDRSNPSTENTDSQSLIYRVLFSKEVTGVDTRDFVLSPNSTGGRENNPDDTPDPFTQTRSPSLAIPNLQTVSDTITVPASINAMSVSVAVKISHAYPVDLKVDLIAPDGTVKILHDRSGSGTINIDRMYNTSFANIPAAGVWTLRINDNVQSDSGILNSWTLTINYGPPFTPTIADVTGHSNAYYVTVPAITDGTYNLDLVSSGHNIIDIAGKSLTNTVPTTGSDQTYRVSTTVVDSTAPTLASIERSSPASQHTNSQTLEYKVTFSEDVTGVDANDFVLSSGSSTTTDPVTGISGSGSVYYATVSVSTSGTYNLDLVSSGHGIEDAAENPLTDTAPTTGTDQMYSVSITVVDSTAPTLASIERSNPASQHTNSQTLEYKVTFSEDVTGVDKDDFVLSPDSAGGGDNNNNNNIASSEQFTQTRSPSLAIPSLQTVSDAITVTDSGTVTSVSVAVNISHTYIGDLKVDLIAPDGTVKILHGRTGGNDNDIVKAYTPNFDGKQVQGAWKLRINDDASGDVGTLNSWTLTINYGTTTTTITPTTISPVTGISGSGDTYYVTVSASTDGTYNLDLVSSGHEIEDAAENPLTDTAPTTGTDQTYSVSTTVVDSTAPTLASIERSSPASQHTNSQTLEYKVIFSEDVTGVDANDFVLSSGSTTTTDPVTGISGSGSVYYATVSVSTSGTYNLDLVSSGHGIEDAAENPLTYTAPTTGTDQMYSVTITVVDSTAPTLASIERSNPASQHTNSQTLEYKVTFSEDVTGVDKDDFVLSNDSAGGGDNNNNNNNNNNIASSEQFTQTRSPSLAIPSLQTVSDAITVTDSGTVTSVSVAVNISHTYIGDLKVDLIAPDGTVKILHGRTGGNDNDIVKAYTPNFDGKQVQGAWKLRINDDASGDVGTLNSWTLTINYGTTTTTITPTTISPVTGISGSGDTYYVTVSASTDGTYNLDLVSSGHEIEDAAENPLTDTAPTTGTDQTYSVSTTVVDSTAPTLASIERSSPASQHTNSQTLEYKVTFSEDVTGVDANDFVLSSGSTTTTDPVTGISGSGSVYYATVSVSTSGTYNLDLVSSGHGIEDAAENPLTDTAPTTGTDQTYSVSITVVDSTAPTLASIERSNPASQHTNSQTLEYKVTFSEDVTGVDANDFVLSNDNAGGGDNNNNTASSEQFTQTRSPSLAIPNLQTVSDSITVPDSGNATSVSVAVNISHTYIGDLKVDLIAPDGTVRTLHGRTGGNDNDIVKTYTPNFDGKQVQGAWTLRINDNFNADDGTLNSWTLTINHGTVTTTPTTVSPVTGISGSGDTYYVTGSASTDGTYNLDLVSSGHGIEDAAENPLTDTAPTTGTDQTYSVSITVVDSTAPTLASIERSSPASQHTNSQTLEYKVIFSEDVTGVDKDDFVLSNDSAGGGDNNNNNNNNNNNIASSEQFTQTRSPSLAIPSLQTVSDAITVTDSGTVTSVSVAVNISHTYIGDLKVDLIAPDGTVKILHGRTGGNDNDIVKAYTPNFDGKQVQGAWKLRINDDASGDVGTLNSWTLTINYGTTTTTITPTTISPVTGISGSGDTYYVTVSASTDGTYNLDLVSSGHGIEDAAENPLTDTAPTTGTDQTYSVSTTVVDSTAPTLASIERSSPASQHTNSQTLEYKVTFSEDVTGVDANDFVLSSGSTTTTDPVTGISGSGSVYYATVSVSTSGTYNLDLVSSGHGIEDAAENPLTDTAPTTGTDQMYSVTITVVDSTAPTLASIERSNPASQHTNSQTLEYKVTFSEDVTGVDKDDFVLSNDNAGGGDNNNNTASSEQFTQTRSPSLAIPNLQTVSDSITVPDSGNATSVSVAVNISHTYIGDLKVDLIAPDGTVKILHGRTGGNDNDIVKTYTPNFDGKQVQGAWTLRINDNFNADDGTLNSWTLTINHGTVTTTPTTVSPVTGISGSGDTYYVTGSASTDGTYNLDLVSSGHGIEDAAENPLTDTAPTTGTDQTYSVSITVVDSTAPTLASIERSNPASQHTNSQILEYKVIFSEDVTGVDKDDFVLSNDNAGGGDNNNNNIASSEQFTQTRSPSLAIPSLQTVSDAITVTDSGTVTSVSVAVNISHTYIGDLKVDLIAPDGTVKILHGRTGGNDNDIVKAYTPNFDGKQVQGAWKLRINDDASGDVGTLNSWTLAISYDTVTTTPQVNPVTGISGSGDTYYVTVSASTDGTYNLDLVSSGHEIEDAAENPLTDTVPTTGTDQTYSVSTTVVDSTAPTLASIERSNPASQHTNSQTLEYKVIFSEDVTGVDANDFVLSSGSSTTTDPVTGISGSGSVYYATVSVSTSGTYNLDLVSSGHGIEDAAENPLTDTAPTTGTDQMYSVTITVVDSTAPTLASIERSNPASQNTNSQTLEYKVTFSEDVTGVDANDFVLSNDNAGGGDNNNNTASSEQFTQTRSPSLAIPNLQTVSDSITVPDSGNATSVSVAVNISHTYIGDLKVDLIAPDGTVRTLHGRTGGNDNDIVKTYTPNFDGKQVQGAWTLRINDNFNADDGTLNSWTLTINHGTVTTTPTTVSPVTGISGSGDTYYVTGSASTDGTYNLDLVSSGHGIEDAAENPLTDTAPTTGTDQTYSVSITVVDSTAPTLASIERNYPASQNTNSQTLMYEVTFSEDVTGVGADDFVLSNDSTRGAGNTTTVSGQFTQTRSPSFSIIDNYDTSDTVTVPDSGTVTSVSVAVNISHTYIGDLKVDLIAPDGTVRTLHDRTGGNDNDIVKTYTPNFDGKQVQGAWKLRINDGVSGDIGTFNSWTLAISYDTVTTTPQVNPVTGISGSGDTYYVTVSASTDGTYNLDLVSSGHGIEDEAGNSLINSTPTTGTDQTYTVSTDT